MKGDEQVNIKCFKQLSKNYVKQKLNKNYNTFRIQYMQNVTLLKFHKTKMFLLFKKV